MKHYKIAIVSFVSTIRMILSFLFITALVGLSECGVKIAASLGEFQNTRHGVSGMVYQTDDYTLEIQNFNYDEWLEESKCIVIVRVINHLILINLCKNATPQ